MKAIILAGGFGTRLNEITGDKIPKPMVPLSNGMPFLHYLIERIKKIGIDEIILSVGHLGNTIINYFNSGSILGINIKYSIEEKPLGTGGAMALAIEKYIKNESFLAINGDTFSRVDYTEMLKRHINGNGIGTLGVKKLSDVSRFGKILIDKNYKISKIEEKDSKGSGFINAGIYILNRDIIRYFSFVKCSFENDVLPNVIENEDLYSFNVGNTFFDIGIPEDYKKFCKWHKRRLNK